MCFWGGSFLKQGRTTVKAFAADHLFERLEVILYALVVRGQMRLSGPVDRAGFGHRFAHGKTGDEGGSHSEGAQKARGVPGGVDGVSKHGRVAVQIWPGAQQGILSADGTRWVCENENVAGRSHSGEHEHGMGQRITLLRRVGRPLPEKVPRSQCSWLKSRVEQIRPWRESISQMRFNL